MNFFLGSPKSQIPKGLLQVFLWGFWNFDLGIWDLGLGIFICGDLSRLQKQVTSTKENVF